MHKDHVLVVAGCDPGSVKMGIGAVRFTGYLDVTDEDGNAVPAIEVVAAELLDLKRGRVLRARATPQGLETERLSQAALTIKSESVLDWSTALAWSVTRADWLFEPFASMLANGASTLPLLVVENQCDGPRSAYANSLMLQISHMFTSAVSAIDTERGLGPRTLAHGMGKYGLRSDGSRNNSERKAKAVAVMKQLLHDNDSESNRRWLAWFEHLEENGEEIDDMADALLLAVHKCGLLVGAHARDQIRVQRALIKKIPLAPMRPPKEKKSKQPKPVKEPKPAKTKKAESKKRKRAEDPVKQALKADGYPMLLEVRELGGKKPVVKKRKIVA